MVRGRIGWPFEEEFSLRKPLSLAGLGLSLLAGCAPITQSRQGPEVRFEYAIPLQGAAESVALAVQGDQRVVVDRVLTRMRRAPFTPGPVDPRGLSAVATYSGDPESFVNCGYVMAYLPGANTPPQVYPAARGQLAFQRGPNRPPAERRMTLNAQITVNFVPQPGTTLVTTETRYVLQKPLDTLARASGEGAPPETIVFSTGESATFSQGTVCQSNGQLERQALESLLNEGA